MSYPSYSDLELEIQELEQENKRLNAEKSKLYIDYECLSNCNADLVKENKKLKEFKAKQEEMMFLIWASIELAKPKTYRDAEKLQKGKERYEKLYKEELSYLKEENKKLREELDFYKWQYEHSMWED